MRLTLEIQGVSFQFNVASIVQLGQITDLLRRFTYDADRANRISNPAEQRPLITTELMHAGDLIMFGDVCLKDARSPQRKVERLVWDWTLNRYRTEP
jgi:hypothetical protein